MLKIVFSATIRKKLFDERWKLIARTESIAPNKGRMGLTHMQTGGKLLRDLDLQISVIMHLMFHNRRHRRGYDKIQHRGVLLQTE